MKQRAIDRFANNIEKLLNGQEVDLYESMIDSSFEYIAAEILSPQLEKGIWYDGNDDLKARLLKKNKVEFSGNMTVGKGQDKFWKEPFIAIVTDKRETGQSMLIYVRIGEIEGEADLFKIEFKYKNT